MRASSGRSDNSVTPSPSWPAVFAPQHQTVPSLRRAHECAPPAAIASTLVSPPTGTGTLLESVLPLPSWPLSFAPQQLTVASPSIAQVWRAPAAIARACPSPLTSLGTYSGAGSGAPSCPSALRPQHSTRPPASAQLCAAPVVIASAAAAPLSSVMAVGDACSTPRPSPSWPSSPRPQHEIAPSASIAQLCAPPAASAFGRPSSDGTGSGPPG